MVILCFNLSFVGMVALIFSTAAALILFGSSAASVPYFRYMTVTVRLLIKTARGIVFPRFFTSML